MILCGDALVELRKLPDESVNCCVTSPPYWGLRDYGTAKWEGGDPECDHRSAKEKSRYDYPMPESAQCGTHKGMKPGTDSPKWKDTCPSCGATKNDSQLGLEKTPEEYVAHLVEVFREVRRALRTDGTLWLNLGDSYAANGARRNNNGEGASTMGWPGQRKETLNKAAKMVLPAVHSGLKPKDLVGIPWRVAFALQADGWWLRQDIIWAKPNPMPESVRDRCTKAHEYIFMLTKSARYWYDAEEVKEQATGPLPWGGRPDGKITNKSAQGNHGKSSIHQAMTREEKMKWYGDKRNLRSVWPIATRPYAEAHFATFPPEIPELCIKAGCPKGGVVLDPFFGAGTTGLVAMRLGREFIGIDLSPAYCEIARKRIYGTLMEARP